MITSLMMTLRTKYGSSWLDFFNLEDFINLLDDYEPYLYDLSSPTTVEEFIGSLDGYGLKYNLDSSDDVLLGTEYLDQ